MSWDLPADLKWVGADGTLYVTAVGGEVEITTRSGPSYVYCSARIPRSELRTLIRWLEENA